MPDAVEQIALRDVHKRYQAASGVVTAVEAFSLSVKPREFVTLLGPSGAASPPSSA